MKKRKAVWVRGFIDDSPKTPEEELEELRQWVEDIEREEALAKKMMINFHHGEKGRSQLSVSISNIKELREAMKAADIDPDYYTIYPDNGFHCDTVCYIRPQNGEWEIGTHERGIDHHVHRFDTEAEACQRFIKDFFREVLTNEK